MRCCSGFRFTDRALGGATSGVKVLVSQPAGYARPKTDNLQEARRQETCMRAAGVPVIGGLR